MRHAPAFWWRARPTMQARLLQPLGALYGALTERRMAQPGLVLPVPVLCVGNFVAGGAGKTPTALALAELLRARGHRPAFLSRGYGRTSSRAKRDDVIAVDPARHGADAVGDEPLLLAGSAPTFVAADRRAAARHALAAGATVLILDDGLQNPSLAKTFALAVVDGVAGFGNGLCLPAGPLRAPTARQWPFVRAACIIGEGAGGDAAAAGARRHGIPVIKAQLRPDPAIVAALREKPLLAFAGIGRPEKFFATLADQGLTICGKREFADHYAYTEQDCAALRAEAMTIGATLVTTTKDRVRLPADFLAATLPVTLAFEDLDAMESLLDRFVPAPSR